MRTFATSYKVYDGKDSLTIVDFDENKKFPPSMRLMIECGVSRGSVNKILSETASYKIWKTSSTNDALACSDFSELETAVKKIQSFWRHHFPRIQKIRAFHKTVQGRMINTYLDLVASHTPADYPARSKIPIRALFFTKGIELQASLGVMAEKHKALHAAFSALFDEATISPARLEALQEARARFSRDESAAVDMKKSWTVATLVAQTWWWVDAALLDRKLSDDLEALESIQARTEEVEAEVSAPEPDV